MYHVYLLRRLPTGRTYIGTTKHLQRRLQQHATGRSRATAPYRPWQLIRSEAYGTLGEARRREWYLKCTPAGGKEKQKLIAGG